MRCLTMPQQVWLQSMMSHRVVTDDHALEMYTSATRACEQELGQDDYNLAYKEVSRALSRLGFEIRRTIDEGSGLTLVALVNTKGDSTAELATQYSPQEMALIKSLVRAIFTAPDDAYCVSTTQAVNIGRRLAPPLASARTEAMCDDLIQNGWLRVMNETHYKLSARALLELQSYLQAEFPEHFHQCTVCLDLVTSGFACSQATCETYVHKHCKVRHESDLPVDKRDASRKLCSACEKPWQPRSVGIATRKSDAVREASQIVDAVEEAEEGERDGGGADEDEGDRDDAENDASDNETGSRRANAATRSQASLRRLKREHAEVEGASGEEEDEDEGGEDAGDDENDDDDDDDEDDKAVAVQKRRRSSRRRSSTDE